MSYLFSCANRPKNQGFRRFFSKKIERVRQISLCISQDVRVKSSSFSNVVLIASLIEFFWNIFDAELSTFFNVSRPAINFDRNR